MNNLHKNGGLIKKKYKLYKNEHNLTSSSGGSVLTKYLPQVLYR